jgi:hypothetical protein
VFRSVSEDLKVYWRRRAEMFPSSLPSTSDRRRGAHKHPPSESSSAERELDHDRIALPEMWIKIGHAKAT